MGKFKDLKDKVFDSIKVIERVRVTPNGGSVIWKVECLLCGNQKEMRSDAIQFQNKACGCLGGPVTHGLSHHPVYNSWVKMRDRCLNPNVRSYKDYGARGITICQEWREDPKAFIDWALDNGWKKV